MAKKSLRRGLFITFEGTEGCGKSTQSRLLYDCLKCSYDCVYTREPGGTAAGDYIRHILLHSKKIKISDMAEVFLFEAARAQIVREVIRPSLKAGRIIICDRFSDATIAYQGYGGKIPLKLIESLNAAATEGLKPDLTIILDIDINTGLRRAKKKGIDRMEAKDIAYHRRVRAGYLKLAKSEPKRIKIIKVESDLYKTQENIRALILRNYLTTKLCHFPI